MEDMNSSKLALRSLLKDSKEKRANSILSQERAIVSRPAGVTSSTPETDERRKEQLKLGKVIFEFFEQAVAPAQEEEFPKKGKGRPTKAKIDKARNITICLSKEHIELLDKATFNENTKGRGRKVRFLMDSFLKYQKREKEQIRAVQEAIRVVNTHLDTFSRNYKRSEKFSENERTITDLEKAISNLRIVISLLKIDGPDLKRLLTDKEWSTYQFSLNWLSNKVGDQ